MTLNIISHPMTKNQYYLMYKSFLLDIQSEYVCRVIYLQI